MYYARYKREESCHIYSAPDVEEVIAAAKALGMHLGPEGVFSIGSAPWNSCPPSIIFVQEQIEEPAPSLVSPARQPGYRPGPGEDPLMASSRASRPSSSG
jgi:hypothetical protein